MLIPETSFVSGLNPGHLNLLQPKLTITLLDQDDLRALAHLMNSYPSVLKEKALLAQATVVASK